MALAVLALGTACIPVAADAAFPGENGRIAYGTRHDTYSDDDPSRYWIRTVRPDGSAARRIDGAINPTFSPRGASIAYASYDVGGYHGLFVDHVSGSARSKRITHREGDAEPAWSPSGRRLVFVRDDDLFSGLWIHYARGNRFLTAGVDPDWSVRGHRLQPVVLRCRRHLGDPARR